MQSTEPTLTRALIVCVPVHSTNPVLYANQFEIALIVHLFFRYDTTDSTRDMIDTSHSSFNPDSIHIKFKSDPFHLQLRSR